ncbi:MAG: biotin-dependent carboxyltransferase family protein [Desulfomonilaceae bacterium]
MEVFKVLEPGPFTTIQDAGRYGYQQFGIPVSGALDKFSFLAGNALVGNGDSDAVLEITFMGPRLEGLSDALVAVTGADVPLFINGQPQTMWTSFRVRRGDIISMKAAVKGVRAYLAIAGGFDVPPIMGSRSTYTGGKIGGLEGRPLAAGDILHRELTDSFDRILSLPEDLQPTFGNRITLRALPGPQDDYFDTGLAVLFEAEFAVTSKADCMGYRLEGPIIEPKAGAFRSIISEPSLSGSIQIPPDGCPIILLVEQTVGGYAKIATIITPDLDSVAQARPGDKIRFARVDLTEAHRLYRDYRSRLGKLQHSLRGESSINCHCEEWNDEAIFIGGTGFQPIGVKIRVKCFR